MRKDFEAVESGLREVPHHDHDFLAWNALERIERRSDAMREALEPFAEFARRYRADPHGFLVGPSPLMAVMTECEAALAVLDGETG